MLLLGAIATPLPAQEPPKLDVQLRFDQAQREELSDDESSPDLIADSSLTKRPFAFKLNRKRVNEERAYDRVTLWNIEKAKIKKRRMRLSDSTAREKVYLMKLFTTRNPRKGARPHLLGNVAGYTWEYSLYDSIKHDWVKTVKHISRYTLRSEYDSLRLADKKVSLFKVPDELWHPLSNKAVYILDSTHVHPRVFQFIDGLFLRTLNIFTDTDTQKQYNADQGVVWGDIFPDRTPLVVFNGHKSSIETWFQMCQSNSFSPSATVPMLYFYILPVEALQTYGIQGKYGAIYIEMAE